MSNQDITNLRVMVGRLTRHEFLQCESGCRAFMEEMKDGTYLRFTDVVRLLDAEPDAVSLCDIEKYRQQMAGIGCAAFGYWKEGDSIHPDFDTVTLRDVAKLYAKYKARMTQLGQLMAVLRELERQADLSLDYRPEFRRAIAEARAALAAVEAA